MCFNGKYPIFSKHKIKKGIWKILIYNPDDKILTKQVDGFIKNEQNDTNTMR